MDDGLTWLSLPAHMASLADFTEFVRGGARQAAVPDAELCKLDLILEEILVNVFRYAYPPGESGTAAVGYAAGGGDRLLVQVRDGGRAYNPLEAAAPDLAGDLEDRPIGGLGVFLVRSLAESVTYGRENGENVLSFQLKY